MPGRPYSHSVTRIRVTNSETPAWTRSDSAALGPDHCRLARGTAAAGRHLRPHLACYQLSYRSLPKSRVHKEPPRLLRSVGGGVSQAAYRQPAVPVKESTRPFR